MLDHPATLLKYLLPPLLAAPVMIWAYRQFRFAQQWRFIFRPLCGMALVLAGLLAIGSIPQSPRDPWSPTRLAPIVGWVNGYPLYPPPGDGPVIVRMYGPVSSIIYLPATLASTPTTATLIAACIDFGIFILPGIWFIRRATRGLGGEIALAAIAIFLAVVLQHPVLSHSATMVTVDAPAIGLATCAMAVLIKPKDPTRAAMLAGLFAALSIWAKQTMTPILPAIVLYMLLATPLKPAMQRIGIVLAIVAGFSLLMLLLFGWGSLWFNLVTVPGNRNWQWPEPTTAAVMLRSLRTIWGDAMPVGWLLVAAIVIRHDGRISKNPWMLPLLAAILVLPLSMIAYAQVGGESNHASPIIYFSLLSCVTALAGACSTDVPGGPLAPAARIARLALISILAGALVIHPGKWADLPQRLTAWSTVRESPTEAAFAYAKSHPGEAWFPKQPLASLLAEGKLYHFDEGLYAMQLAGVKVDPEWYGSGLPDDLRVVAYRGDKPEGPMSPPPGFDRITTSSELPGWVLIRRAE